MTPITTVGKLPTPTPGNAAALQKYGTQISKVGSQLSASAATVAKLPPPTFPGGADYASKAVKAVKQFGSLFSQVGQRALTKDLKGIQDLTKQVNSGPIEDLDALKLAPDTARAIAGVPACQKVGFP